MLFGIVGMLNSIVFAVALKKLSAEPQADSESPEATPT
jgi:predicted PurR-regulated permease PerM